MYPLRREAFPLSLRSRDVDCKSLKQAAKTSLAIHRFYAEFWTYVWFGTKWLHLDFQIGLLGPL